MPARRLLMRKIREVLRLKHERGLSHRAIAQACAIGVGTVTLYLKRTAQQGLGWPLPAELDDAALDAQLFPRPVLVRDRVRPDCAYIHRELKRDGVTLQLLWEEHLQVHPSGYRYTQFCEFYRRWVKRLRPSMRQIHRAGEKTFKAWRRSRARSHVECETSTRGTVTRNLRMGRCTEIPGRSGAGDLMHPLILQHQITPKTSRYTRCSMSMLPNVSINGRIRSSGQLGRWWYSISPCRNSECVRRFTVFAFNQRS